MESTPDRWPSEIPGEAIDPSTADVEAIEAIFDSCRFHGDDEASARDHIWLELPIPVLDASQDPDIRRLRGLVKDGRFPSTCISAAAGLAFMPWQSALNRAIERSLSAHARLLTETGADMDGYPLWCFSKGASRFVRGRPKAFTTADPLELPSIQKTLAGSASSVGGTVTEQLRHGLYPSELKARRASRSRFWAEADFPRLDYPNISPLSSLTVAIKHDDTDLYEFLAANGADESAWLRQVSVLSEPFSASMLAAESPLHVAILKQDRALLQFLLDRQHKPDIFPIVTPTRALSPFMESITSKAPWREGLALMIPRSDLELRTPVFGVHLLHLAVATLDTQLVDMIQNARPSTVESLVSLTPTALGHSALHIACLPFDNTFVNLAAALVAASAREYRMLASEWPSQGYHSAVDTSSAPRAPSRGRGMRERPAAVARTDRPATVQQEAKYQALMVLYVIDRSDDARLEISRQDVHGNTPLHYLAMMRNVELYNDLICKLVELSRGRKGDETLAADFLLQSRVTLNDGPDIWAGTTNAWGCTPLDIYRSNVKAGNRQEDDFNLIPFWDDELRYRSDASQYKG